MGYNDERAPFPTTRKLVSWATQGWRIRCFSCKQTYHYKPAYCFWASKPLQWFGFALQRRTRNISAEYLLRREAGCGNESSIWPPRSDEHSGALIGGAIPLARGAQGEKRHITLWCYFFGAGLWPLIAIFLTLWEFPTLTPELIGPFVWFC